MFKKNNNLLYCILCLVLFIIISYLYANPVLSGKHLFQHDIVQYKGGAKELLDYRAQQGKETYWSDSMFGGMPTYQMGAQFRGDVIKQIDALLISLPKPVNYLFLLFAGFFLLGMVVVRNWKYALLGATCFGLSTYFYIIIAAGHNGKVHTIAYFAPLVAGIILVYLRKKYIWGFIVTTLFMGLQIAANHPQMTYYLFLALAFLFLSELYRTIRKKVELKHFLISTGIIALSCILGVAMNAQRIMANAEYVKETVRGKQILDSEKHSSEKKGMDKESILMWSYGKTETLNLFIPRLMGGASMGPDAEKIIDGLQGVLQNNVQSEEQYNQVMGKIVQVIGSPSYWGDQPGTSGPAYQGAVVVFLAILGFFFAPNKYRYWILGATVLSLALAWGSNFMFLSDFFIDYVPFYNKFRAPSSILVVVELLFPLIAILGLYQFFKTNDNDQKLQPEYKKKVLLYVTGSVIGITLLLLVFGKTLLGFQTEDEKTYLPDFVLDYLANARYQMFKIDAIKAMVYVGIVFGALYFSLKNKLSTNAVLLIVGAVSFFDLWSVNRDYLDNDNFVDKILAENPFQTEISDLLIAKIGNNSNLKSIYKNVNVNKTLETLAEKDQSHYRIYNQLIRPFEETNTSYFKSSVGGYHAVKLRRYDDLINHYFATPDPQKRAQIPEILNLLNTKYVIGGKLEEPQVLINPESNGNAWLVSDIYFAKNPNDEINQVGKINTKRMAVISKDDEDYLKNKPLAKDTTATVTLKNYAPNEIELETQSKTPQLAVLSEIYYPHGWKMLVNNVSVPYIKADYLLRAVHVPAGKNTIKMIFEPSVIQKGKTVSMVAFILFILISGTGLWMWGKKSTKSIDASES